MKWLLLVVGLLPGAAEATHRELGQHVHDELWWRCWMVVQLCSQFASSLSKEEVVERSFLKSRWTFDFVHRAVVKDGSLKWVSWPGSAWSTASWGRQQELLVWRRSRRCFCLRAQSCSMWAKCGSDTWLVAHDRVWTGGSCEHEQDIMLPERHTQEHLSAVFSFVCGGFQEKSAEYSLAVSRQTARNEKRNRYVWLSACVFNTSPWTGNLFPCIWKRNL